MRSFAALLAAYACVGVVGLINVEMHFESLCKQCQIHIAGMRDIVLRGGNESSLEEAGVKPWLNITIDYYGAIARDGTCESAAKGTEHGSDICVTDRYHLCAQRGGLSTTSESAVRPLGDWFDFVHCMWMNIDVLKCGNNNHCATSDEFSTALELVFPMCAKLTGADEERIRHCANGKEGRNLQAASYARTKERSEFGFAPIFIDGKYVSSADNIWRKTPNQLHYGKVVLATICEHAVGGRDNVRTMIETDLAAPAACSGQ
mmetsp:Transcript_28549/g.46444  ORF Transcript_28549/g.46444 Transcript_28549/m.46444 type:complete len:261 (+) Transcript_28549:76-858(+)